MFMFAYRPVTAGQVGHQGMEMFLYMRATIAWFALPLHSNIVRRPICMFTCSLSTAVCGPRLGGPATIVHHCPKDCAIHWQCDMSSQACVHCDPKTRMKREHVETLTYNAARHDSEVTGDPDNRHGKVSCKWLHHLSIMLRLRGTAR